MKMFKTCGFLSVLAAAGLCSAADTNYRLHVNVPFAFVVAGQPFAPGEYDVKETDTGVIILQGEGRAAAVLSTPSVSSREGRNSLVFTENAREQHLVGVSVEGEGRRAIPAHFGGERAVALASH